MTYLVALVSAAVTGGLMALLFRLLTGIEHSGILLAVGIIGAGLQTTLLMLWYLRDINRPPRPMRAHDAAGDRP